MLAIPHSVSLADLSADPRGHLDGLRDPDSRLVLSLDGRAAAVMMSVEAFERSERERAMLLGLARGEVEIASGLGHDLDSVLAEADAILAAEASAP